MARKFLYLVAIAVVLVLAAVVVLRQFAPQLTEYAFVPTTKFEPLPRVAAKAYDDPARWISRPDLGPNDPALWLPTDLPATPLPITRAAVFFVHPTSYLDKAHWNGPVSDPTSQARAVVLVRGMASAFSAAGDIWAPRYRQAAIGAFLTDDPRARQALDLAYGDVAQAFDTFLASVPANRPIILAGHSQGSLQLMRLIHERVAGQPLARRIAGAYLIGWPVSLAHDLPGLGLPACTAPDQPGCVVSWLSFADPADPAMMLTAYGRSPGLDGAPRGASPFLCSNPLTGGTGGSEPAAANLGTLLPDLAMTSGKIVPRTVPAQCSASGFLMIGPGPNLGPYVLPGNNYHVYDIPLFWSNLRADAVGRVNAWKP